MTKVVKLKFNDNHNNLFIYEEILVPIADGYEVPLEGIQIVCTVYPFGLIETITQEQSKQISIEGGTVDGV